MDAFVANLIFRSCGSYRRFWVRLNFGIVAFVLFSFGEYAEVRVLDTLRFVTVLSYFLKNMENCWEII